MQINLVKSKIHKLRITATDLEYQGSITLDQDLVEAAGLREFERVQVLNENNGERLETYVIVGERGSGVCCLNGPAARKGHVGDMLIVLAYAWMTEEEAKGFQPKLVFPNPKTNSPA
jgi:aspartate 1-decarboxylase